MGAIDMVNVFNLARKGPEGGDLKAAIVSPLMM